MHKDLKALYKEKIVPSLIKDFGYQNTEQVPKLVKISINRGLGEASKNSKELNFRQKNMGVQSSLHLHKPFLSSLSYLA